MGIPGRKPTPNHLKLVKGNPGKRALSNAPEPPPPATPPRPPAYLSRLAKREWRRIVPILLANHLLTDLDTVALETYCNAYAQYVEAHQVIQQAGVLVKTPNGFPVQSPMLAIANKAFDQMTKILTEFGLTPSSRARVKAPPKQSADDDWTEF